MLPVIPVQASRATQELPPLVIPAQAGTQLSLFKSQIRVRGHKGREKRSARAGMTALGLRLFDPVSQHLKSQWRRWNIRRRLASPKRAHTTANQIAHTNPCRRANQPTR